MKMIFKLRSMAMVAALISSLGWTTVGFGQTPSTNNSDASAQQPNAKISKPAADSSKQDTPLPEENQNYDAAAKDKKYPHSGGENDVDAIGNRKIGGRGLGDWYSYEKEIAIGKEYAQQIEQSVKLVTDPVVNEYVNRLGQNLVRNSDAKVPFTIKVVDDDSINAFALPGGFFYVNTGAILAADNEAELAGVMAHEISHVTARHVMRQMTRSNWANIASIPLIFIGGGAGYAARAATSFLVPVTFMKFQRGFEAEADYLGIEYMYHAGYDPQGLVSMFEKFEALEKRKPGALAKAFSSHPQTPDRVAASEKEIATILPPKDSYIENTSEFDEVKARLAKIENHRKLEDLKDGTKPTLRHQTADSTSGNPNGNNDDRPVLKRRDKDNN